MAKNKEPKRDLEECLGDIPDVIRTAESVLAELQNLETVENVVDYDKCLEEALAFAQQLLGELKELKR